MARPKRAPFRAIRKTLKEGFWWCSYGMHSFESNSSIIPIDCPMRHEMRVTLSQEIQDDLQLKEYYRGTYGAIPIEALSNKQVVDLISRIKVPDDGI